MSDKKVIVGVNVTPAERQKVHELARSRGYQITSDYIRDLIIADAALAEFNIEFEVDRGGDRRQQDGSTGG